MELNIGCRTFAEFLFMLEDGQLARELQVELETIATACNDLVGATGKKAKASLSLTIDFEKNAGLFEIKSKYKTTLPKEPRMMSVAWTTRDGAFTPQNPRQMNLQFSAVPAVLASKI
jgi:hypothetical protein